MWLDFLSFAPLHASESAETAERLPDFLHQAPAVCPG
jgi:hypothetical protein